ncbi:acyl-CoA synthetase [soil metagenome]
MAGENNNNDNDNDNDNNGEGDSMIISGERQIGYAEMHERIALSARGLAALGFEPGAQVALMMRNDFEFFEIAGAASAIGSPIVPINWHLKSAEVAYILGDSGAAVLVCHADLLPTTTEALGGDAADVKLFVVPTPPEIAAAFDIPEVLTQVPPGCTDWRVCRESGAAGSAAPQAPRSAMPMFYTSGTTGRPKGVRRRPMLPEQQARADRASATAYGIQADAGQVVLLNGPLYHSAPNSYGMLAFRRGCTIVLHARFDALETLQLIARHRVTNMHMVPTMFVRLLRLPDADKHAHDLSSLRFVVHGAAPCAAHIKRAMIDWWGLVINEYFGSTETGIPIWHSAAEALAKPGTVGRLIEGGRVAVVRPDGTACHADEPGEIFMRQTALPDFDYQSNPAARLEADHAGLVSVGDVGYLDADGYLFLCDRKRDMVISGGVNIYPAEIEGVLFGLAGVRDCAVFGLPDDEFGEKLCACIELEPGAVLDAAGVRSFLRQQLANFKVPQRIEFCETLPREASGKIFKRKLREQLLAEGAARLV